MRRLFSLALFFSLSPNAIADNIEQESIRVMQEQQQREKQFSVEPTFISHSSFSQIAHFPVAETPCFFINQIQLHPSTDNTFAFLIPKLLKHLSIPASLCIGEKNLKIIQETVQNKK